MKEKPRFAFDYDFDTWAIQFMRDNYDVEIYIQVI